MTNIQTQHRLDKRKWILSEKLGNDLSGYMDYCDFCPHRTSDKKCKLAQVDREINCICAKAYNKMHQTKNIFEKV